MMSPARVIGNMLGSDLIGIMDIYPFRVLLGSDVKQVRLIVKKTDRNTWQKSVMLYDNALFHYMYLSDKIQTYCDLLI
jgi:hypothetical protein